MVTFSAALWLVTMSPAVEDILSLGTDVLGTHSKLLAVLARRGFSEVSVNNLLSCAANGILVNTTIHHLNCRG